MVGHPSQLVQKNLNECKTGIGMHLSPRENCIYEEAENVCHVGKITKGEKREVRKLYKEANMPRHFGMCECNVIVRNHENENMKQIMEKWWKYYLEGVKRDQLYFTYTVYISGFKFTDINTFGASVNDNVHFFKNRTYKEVDEKKKKMQQKKFHIIIFDFNNILICIFYICILLLHILFMEIFLRPYIQ